jgi:hypothetical protein
MDFDQFFYLTDRAIMREETRGVRAKSEIIAHTKKLTDEAIRRRAKRTPPPINFLSR